MKQIDKQSLIDIEDTTRRLSNPFPYFFFVVRMTWMFWKFCFINPGQGAVLDLVYYKMKAGAAEHGPNIWTKEQLESHLRDEFKDIFGWGSLYLKK